MAEKYGRRKLVSDDEVENDMMMARVRPSGADMAVSFPARSQSATSLKFDEQAQLAEEAEVGSAGANLRSLQVNEGEEGLWIKKNIKCRECRYLVPADDSSDDEVLSFGKNVPTAVEDPSLREATGGQIDSQKENTNTQSSKHKRRRSKNGPENRKCQCGYTLQEHSDPQAAEEKGRQWPNKEWEHSTHTSPVPTNAFGEIEFVGYGDKVAKYVRVDCDTKMDTIKKLMTENWRMERPNLLISVTGGAKNFLMKGRLKEAFRRGLMKAALSTGAWIVTGGTNAGVMKHVGEAVRDYGLTAEGRVTAIGIAPWGCVQSRDVLVDSQGKWPANYRIQDKQKSKQSFLDPNHTHFILADNGTQRIFGTEIEFRAKLEKEISQWTTNTGSDAVRVPVALLVLEGGPGTLKTVMNAIKNNTPAIVIQGSGKCADVLAHAAQNITETQVTGTDSEGKPVVEMIGVMDEKLKGEIKQMVEETISAKQAVQCAAWVEKCMAKPHLISVFEMDTVSASTSTGVDMAILKALLKANKDQEMDQLKLALAWNRIDIAKSEIFTDERPWKTGALDDMMMSAIQLNRVDFVDLFLDNGVSLKDFLTVRRLLKLYNEIPKNSQLYPLLLKAKHIQRQRFSLEDVGILLQDLMGDYFQPEYLKDDYLRNLNADIILNAAPLSSDNELDEGVLDGDHKLPRPAQDLFLWAVLMNQQDLAKLFWREGNEATAAALVANSLLKEMRRYTDDSDMMQKLQKNADEFEDLAIGVINNCYVHDEQKAQDLLIREMSNWGHATCVLIAVQADNKRFISQTACQSLLSAIWMGKMSQDNGLMRLIPSMFIFPLILVLIKFKDEERRPSDTYTPKTAKSALDKRPVLKRELTQAQLKREGTQSSMAPEEHGQDRVAAVLDASPGDDHDKPTGISRSTKLQSFYTSPVVIFILNCISYLIFLGLYSYILVVQLSPTFHFLEGILIVWVVTISVEEGRQLVTNYAHSWKSKLMTYVTDSWNRLDIVTLLLFFVGIGLRFSQNDTCFSIARVVLSINLVTFFFRILHIFSVNKELGPKLVMIRRMIRDLRWFVVILVVFIGAYAIASEAILYPETELSWKLLYYLPRKAYWLIYGELFLEEIEGDDSTCTNDPLLYSGYNQPRCPSEVGKFLVPFLMGIYVLMTNVLLLNLLIAMFSYTFQMIQENTDTHWYFQRFSLIIEYYERPWLPPPFMLFLHLFMLFKYCKNGCNQTPRSSDLRKQYINLQEEKKLVQWENIIADTYLTKVEAREADSVEGRVKIMMTKLEGIHTKMDTMLEARLQGDSAAVEPSSTGPAVTAAIMPRSEPVKQVLTMPPQLELRLGALEEQVGSTVGALNWIMQTLESSNMGETTPPTMPSPTKMRSASDQERRDAKKQQAKLRKQVSAQIHRRLQLHVESRSPIYPMSFIMRFPIPEDQVPWEVPFEHYEPEEYTSQIILDCPPYADKVDLMELSEKERKGLISFNDLDTENRVSRISYEGHYQVVDGLPLNPKGRTGLRGRGLLGRWGPNIAGDPLVTRWKRTANGDCLLTEGQPTLEFIAVKRKDNRMWAIPGAIALPGEQPWTVLKKYFTMEALGSLMDDPKVKADVESKLLALKEKGVSLYKGYADDARNTDNAWLETCVVNYHDDVGGILDKFELRAGEGTLAVSWLTASSKIALHGSHLYFIKLAAEKHGAIF